VGHATVEIGLFPLGIVLMPGKHVPLHIFEERYRELIGDCLRTGDEFGLILSDADGLRTIGCRARVAEVLHRFPDGRMNIVIEGGDRFRVVRLTAGRSFLTAEVEPVTDDASLAEPSATDVEACLAAYRRVAEAAEADPDELDPSVTGLAFAIAGTVEMEPAAKQEVLEAVSEEARLALLTESLDRATEILELRRVAGRRAEGNGQVIP
jgi:Lon protease-like protein